MCLGRLTAYTHDGTQRWRIALDENAQYIKARSTVAPDGSVVAISGAIYSLGPDGGRRWTVQPWRPAPARSGSEEAPQPTAPTASPWIAPDGTIWVGCARSRLYGIARDGRVKWTYTLDESGEHPTVVDEAGGGWASAHGVNNDDGRERSVRGIIPNEDLLIVDANGLVVFRMPRE
jgi:outer membrane protein assembly factor BamB